MTKNKINGWRIASRIAISVMATLLILSGPGAWATPTTQQLVLAPAPGISCTNPTPGTNGTYVFSCTLTGLTTPPDPVPTPTTPAPTTPAPTSTTTTPAPGPSGVDCLHRLAACGLPNADNTGTISGVSLIQSTRTQYANAGELVRNMEIHGCVEVRAANVTFRNVRFVGNGCHYLVSSFSTGLSIFDAEANCNNAGNSAMAGPGNFTVVRADVHSCENGFDVQGSNVVIQDSWIHDMYTGGGAHTDGVQIGQGVTNVTIQHNSIIVAAPGATSAIISWDEGDPQQQQVRITGNLLSGGTYTLYCPRQGTSDTRVTNNRFGIFEFGHSNACGPPHTSAWSGNVVDATGAQLGPQ